MVKCLVSAGRILWQWTKVIHLKDYMKLIVDICFLINQ